MPTLGQDHVGLGFRHHGLELIALCRVVGDLVLLDHHHRPQVFPKLNQMMASFMAFKTLALTFFVAGLAGMVTGFLLKGLMP